jgi:hypothetical protein
MKNFTNLILSVCICRYKINALIHLFTRSLLQLIFLHGKWSSKKYPVLNLLNETFHNSPQTGFIDNVFEALTFYMLDYTSEHHQYRLDCFYIYFLAAWKDDDVQEWFFLLANGIANRHVNSVHVLTTTRHLDRLLLSKSPQ